MLEARLAGRNAIVWRAKSGDISDNDPSFLVAYLPLEFGTEREAGAKRWPRKSLKNTADASRKYRNGLGLAVPAADQIEILRRSVRYLIAIEDVSDKSRTAQPDRRAEVTTARTEAHGESRRQSRHY